MERVICRCGSLYTISGRFHIDRAAVSTFDSWPAFFIPVYLLDGCFSSQCAIAAGIDAGLIFVSPWTPTQAGVIPFAARCLYQSAVSLFLDTQIWSIEVCDKWSVWFCLKAELIQGSGSCHDFLMCIHGTTLGCKKVIIAIYLIEMRPFYKLYFCTIINVSSCFWF